MSQEARPAGFAKLIEEQQIPEQQVFYQVRFGSGQCLIGSSTALSRSGSDCTANLPFGQGTKMLHESPPTRVTILACNHVLCFVNSRLEEPSKGIERIVPSQRGFIALS